MDPRAIAFFPFGVAVLAVFFYGLSKFVRREPVFFDSPKFWLICGVCSFFSCCVLIVLRIKSRWIQGILTPALTFAAFIIWVTAEKLITGSISW
jgi:hypothetical protein